VLRTRRRRSVKERYKKIAEINVLKLDKAAAEHLLSTFSSPFFGMKLLYYYGFWG
jgi:hypothetical protein